MQTLLRSTTVLSMGLAVMGLLLHKFNRGRRRLATHPAAMPPERREAHRRIKLAGAANLRDLGGYHTHDGRRVRWGALYRSDHLYHLSRRDQQVLMQLGLVTLIDLRSEAERLRQPNRLPANHGINVVEIPILEETSGLMADLRERFERGDLDGIDPAALLSEANEQFVTCFTPSFRQFIQTVQTTGGAPLLFHCTAGKDRTGFAAALTLHLLGVPGETILADYLRSNEYTISARRRELALIRLTRGEHAASLVRQLLGVKAAYLETAFATIDRIYGSFDAYVREGLGLQEEDLAQLRIALLE
ncbi:MAG: tyrosine-protein phosphatase [Chloroflexia bacterium]|nr:tyrosine-protein phosphatase [Chloroflexia bacterium]